MDDEFDQWQQAVVVQPNHLTQQQTQEQQSHPRIPQEKDENENNMNEFKINAQEKKDDYNNSQFVDELQPKINLSYNSWEEGQKITVTNANSINFNMDQYININKDIQKQFQLSPSKNIHHHIQQTNVQLIPNSNPNFEQLQLIDQEWQQAKVQPSHYQAKNLSQGFSLQTSIPTNIQPSPQSYQSRPIDNTIQNNMKDQKSDDDDEFGQFQSSTPITPNTEAQAKTTEVQQEKKIPQNQNEQKKQPSPYIQPLQPMQSIQPIQPIQTIQNVQPIQPQMVASGVFQRPKIKKPVYSQQDIKRASQIINKIPDYSYINSTYFME